MPIITINDKQIEVEKGTNVIQAAQKIGIEIPHYCYHPGLRIDGNCRMCLVEVKGPRGFMPQIACNTQCTDGLEVKSTDTNAVKDMRRNVMEFLLHNHPIDCPICDQAGECKLQDYYMKYGQYDNRSIVDKVHKNKVVDIGPQVMLDQERCVLCSRCVRFCEDVSKTNELVITNRGVHSKIEVFPGTTIENRYSGNVVDICPVGALTSKDFRFKMRVWFMSTTKSVCQGCSRGCNIFMDYKGEEVYRFKPRENTEVNDYWICDEGRLSYKEINKNRLLEAFKDGEMIDYNDAFSEMFSMIKNTKSRFTPKSIAAIASPHSTVEDNWMLKNFMTNTVGSDKIFGADFRPDGYQDELLIRADKTPNRKGLEYLEINRNQDDLINALKSKEIKLLIVMNNDIIGEGSEQIKSLLDGIEVISLSTHNTETSKNAKLSLPVSNYSEKYGSIINFEGQLQKFERAFDTFQLEDSLAVPEWELFANLIKEFDSNKQYFDIEDVWSEIREHVKAFSGLSYYDIGDKGINIPNKIKSEEEKEIIPEQEEVKEETTI
jgi:NADH-quinone oxidoreductase subunit G